MFASKIQAALTESEKSWPLVRRLLSEQALGQWKRYAVAFVLMGIAAAATALSAYLIGNVINAAYVDQNMPAIISFAILVGALFITRAVTTYGHQVMLGRIGNAIIAQNQRRMFEALVRQNLAFFADRHSSEFAARLTTGANSASNVINLLVSAVGRDLLTLIGLVAVMIVQDPMLALITLVFAPPALVLRTLIRRIYAVARNRFTGGARILETMQETVQGIRIVKSYTLEGVMQAKVDADIAELERESNKGVRITSRASPLLEGLAGVAIALSLVYGGYRIIKTGSTPGQFFSFLSAAMLAFEPAKRLARVNLELNAALVGVRVLFEIVDSPPNRADRRRQARAENLERQGRVRQRALRLPSGRGGDPGHDVRRRARPDDRAGRAVRRRQVHGVQPAAAVLRARPGQHRDRRPGHRRRVAPLAAPADRLCRPGRVPVPRHDPRQHRHRQARRERSRDRRRRQGRACPRIRHRIPGRLRHAGRRARRAAFRRRAPARRHRRAR